MAFDTADISKLPYPLHPPGEAPTYTEEQFQAMAWCAFILHGKNKETAEEHYNKMIDAHAPDTGTAETEVMLNAASVVFTYMIGPS
jgi:hypothetical protein